jgi:hypothetical protein
MEAIEYSRQLSTPAPRLYLTDLRNARTLPFGLLKRQEYISNYLLLTDGLTVVVGAHPLLSFFMNALVRLGVPLKNLVFVETMEAAMQLFSSYLSKENL